MLKSNAGSNKFHELNKTDKRALKNMRLHTPPRHKHHINKLKSHKLPLSTSYKAPTPTEQQKLKRNQPVSVP